MPSDRWQLAILHRLSNLVIRPERVDRFALDFVDGLAQQERQDFLAVAQNHRVLLRCLRTIANQATKCGAELPHWLSQALVRQECNAQHSVAMLASVCSKLSAARFPAVVIKSLDHWPDLGGDFDIHTVGSADDIRKVMEQHFDATVQAQSWADRLAGKWRFVIPALEKSIEIHLGGLGQAGQQARIGRLTLGRKITRTFGSHQLSVPSPEDQILIRAIDRCYRHYSLRLCDIVDAAQVILGDPVDFDYVKCESKRAGIRKGVCSYLSTVAGYYSHYAGEPLCLPAWVRKGATFNVDKVYAHAGLFRIPLFPQGARLFRYELSKAIRRKDVKKAVRTGLIPTLAIAAGARFRITGRDKGIW